LEGLIVKTLVIMKSLTFIISPSFHVEIGYILYLLISYHKKNAFLK
jgi:hypothetical protein